MKRERMTWAAGRQAGAAPATPGYGAEDQDHPAHQAEPGESDYENGDTSSWNEDPKKPPYPQGNPPSTPGYDTEDKDHPAHKEMPRVPKEAQNLKAQIVKKADKCIKLATVMLGKGAKEACIEDQALDLMDLSDEQIDGTLARMSGGFMAAEEEVPADEDAALDAMLAEEAAPPAGDEGILAQLDALKEEVKALKQAGQNDPKGETLAPKPKSEEEARKTAARKLFASMDADGDGFIMKADWTGSKELFAALDKDDDEILEEEEVVEEMSGSKKACGCDDGFAPEEQVMLAEMEMEACKAASKKADDDDDEDEEAPVEEEAPKEAKKAGDDDDEDDDKEEAPAPEEEEDEASKEASTFSMTTDPMGLADGSEKVASEDDALLASIFGGKTAADEEEAPAEEEAPKEAKKAKKGDDEDEDDGDIVLEEPAEEKEAKKATKTAFKQRPQPKKPSTGIKTVGAVTKTASSNEMDDLSRLWESAPDVSGVFGGSK